MMTFEQYWTALVKHWGLIVICFLAAGAGTFLGSKLVKPLYQSSALVQVALRSNHNMTDYDSLLASDQLVQTEAILATSDTVLRQVASHYQNLTAQQLAQEVTATTKLNTQLFEIDVQDASPTRAAALANDIAATLNKQQLRRFNQNSAQSGDFLLIAQPAQPVLTPVRPNKLLNTAVGLLIGLLLGMLLVLLFELLDKRVRSPEALSQLLGWPILATFWLAHSSKNKKEAVFNPTGHNANVEPFRILRTNIGFSASEKPLRSIVVTSTSPLEGKSTVAANLAIFMAKAGKTTLLIDTNLRRPTLQQLFGLSADKEGLSNAIQAFSMQTTAISKGPSNTPNIPISLDPFIHVVDIPNLYIMPSGPLPPNPPELLDSKAMQRLFAALTNYGAEAVIFDTPPLLGLSDARILASKADGTLVVVDIIRANKKMLEQVKTLLVQVGAYVPGCVVNKQRHSRNDPIYSYYHSSDQQKDKSSHSTKNTDTPAALPATSETLKQSETLPQQNDELDRTKTQSQPDLLDRRRDG
ncbi:MAG TPA: polysaccharide biosynthesis tyrosine autokinase [Ktedonobacteraceae bacterium]|nr:polysaccharide biosynthesis tyrosine autokinase [Ktedonobacteraceae bacterium]